MNLQDRVKVIRSSNDIGTQAKLGDVLGVSEARIKSIETGRVKDISATEANKMVKYFNLNMDWLLTGEGSMHKNETTPVVKSDSLEVPYLNLELSMGGGSFFNDQKITKHFAFNKKFIKSLNPTKVENLLMLNTFGDSMQPTIQAPEKVMIDKGVISWVGDAIYAIQIDDVLMLKRLQKIGTRYKVISDNHKVYDPFYIDADTNFSILGRLKLILRVL